MPCSKAPWISSSDDLETCNSRLLAMLCYAAGCSAEKSTEQDAPSQIKDLLTLKGPEAEKRDRDQAQKPGALLPC